MAPDDMVHEQNSDQIPDVPRSHDATRAADDPDQTLIYDVEYGDGAWIQGYTVNPENLKA